MRSSPPDDELVDVDDAYVAEAFQDAENDRADRFADDLSELRDQGIDADAAIAEVVNREVGFDMAMFSDIVVEYEGRETSYGDFVPELTDDYTRLAKTVARDIAFERRRQQPLRVAGRRTCSRARASRRTAPGRHQGSRRATSRSSGGGSSGSDPDLADPDGSEPGSGLHLWPTPEWGACNPPLLRLLIGVVEPRAGARGGFVLPESGQAPQPPGGRR